MFKTRLISGIVLVILALATIICSGPVLLVTLIGVSCIGMQELYRAAGVHEGKTNGLEIAGYLAVVIYYLTIAYLPVSYHLPAVILGVLVMMCIFVFTYPKYQNKQIMTAFFGMIYVGVMLSYIYQTRVLPGGAFLVWMIFLCSWGCDTCAYCVGVLIGKHKMAPVLSPKKSIEGAVGGVLGAALLGAIYAAATGAYNPNPAHTPLIYASPASSWPPSWPPYGSSGGRGATSRHGPSPCSGQSSCSTSCPFPAGWWWAIRRWKYAVSWR